MPDKTVQPVPVSSNPKRGFLQRFGRFLLAIVAALTAFFSIGYWMLSVADQSEKIEVVVAAKDLTSPKAIEAGDFIMAKLTKGTQPLTAVTDLKAVEGVTLVAPMSRQEVLTTNHLAQKVSANSESLLVSKDLLGMALPTNWLTGNAPKAAVDDYITVMGSLAEHSVDDGTFLLAEHVRVLKIDFDKQNQPERLLLDVDPIQAANLLQARANRLSLLVLVEPAARND